MKILHQYSSIATVSFPVGRPPRGTCEFASDICLKECAAMNKENRKPGDTIGYKPKKRTLEFITQKPLFEVCAKIVEELTIMKSPVLYWFGAGDCARKHSDKIIKIMKHLNIGGIAQCGFTRNRTFWTEAKTHTNLVLTIEKLEDAKKVKINGIIAIPDYKTGAVKLYQNNFHDIGACSSAAYTSQDGVKHEANCGGCLENRRGCFSQRSDL